MSGRTLKVQRRDAWRFASLTRSHTHDPRVDVVHGPLKTTGVDLVQSILVLVGSVVEQKALAETFWEFTPMAGEVDIIESVALGKPRVDRAAGIIHDVKLLGKNSANNNGKRQYTDSAMEKAVTLYEGASVNLDHDLKGGSRKVEDRFGKAENVKFIKGEGLRGDLRYNVEHPRANQVAWFAEHMPDALGFSPHQRGACRMVGGVEMVEEIKSVRCVDLVADPATTKSLFESVTSTSAAAAVILDDATLSKADKVRRIQELLEGSETPNPTPPKKDKPMDKNELTLDLVESRPDLVQALIAKQADAQRVKTLTEEVANLQKKLDDAAAATALANRKAANEKLLTEAKLPAQLITPHFKTLIENAPDDTTVKALIEDRKLLIGTVNRPRAADPTSVDASDRKVLGLAGERPDSKSFAAGLKGR